MTTYPRDNAGEIQIDFVWGNLPLQPDEDRGEDTLNMSLDNHVIADIGWSNYPAYIPNYSGDEDADLEYVVPDLLRITRSAAWDLLDNHNTNLDLFAIGHNLTVNRVATAGKTVRVYAYDTDSWNDGQGALNGLRVGDELYFTSLEIDEVPTSLGTIKVTAVNDEGEEPETYFEFEVSEAYSPDIDELATGYVWAGPNLEDVITLQRFWNAAGSIKNPGTNIHVRYFSLD
jgi:hypothetical protein